MHKSFTLSRLGLAILLLTISIGPFFQGYFFPNPTLVAMAATAGAFGLWALGRRQQRLGLNLPGGWTGTLLLVLTAWCLLATAWAVYLRDHLTLVLQVATAFAVFTLVRAENAEGVRRSFVWLLSVSAVVVAVLGLLEYAGFFTEHMALGHLLRIEPQQYRLFTVFQYPNSAAAFFLVALILQNARLSVSDSWLERTLLATVSAVVATAFALTLSRGALLVTPIGIVLLSLGLSMRQLLSSLLHWVTVAGLPVAVTVQPIARMALAGAWQTVLGWVLVAAVVGALATGLVHALLRLPGRVQVLAGISLLALVLVGSALAAPRVIDQLPIVFSRITQMNTGDLTNSARFEYLRTAGELAARQPWGYGGGGWLRKYTQVQQYHYVARDPHSHYALTLVESGVPGLILLVGTIGLAAFHAYRSRRDDPVRWAMAAAALALAAHAAVDIDLSYYALWLLLWALLGAAQVEPEPVPVKREQRFASSAALTISTAAVLLCTIMFAAARSYDAAQMAVLLGDNEAALSAGTLAIRLDPLNSQYRTLIPTSENIGRALELDPESEQLWRFVSDLLEEHGDTGGALSAAQRALELRPMSVSHYERVANLLVRMMTEALDEGRATDATAIARKVIALGHAMEERGEPALARQKLLFPTYAALTWTPSLNLAAGKAYLVAGERAAAEAHLTAALNDQATAADAALWLHALYARSGNQEALATLEPMLSDQALKSRLYAALLAVH